VYETTKLLSKGLLQSRGYFTVWHTIETRGGDLRGKPVCFGEAKGHGHEMLFDLLLGELIANLVKGLNGLCR